jgi:hypothetical protein
MRFAQLPGRFGDCAVAFEPMTIIAAASLAATAIGAEQQGAAQKNAADYQAQVAANNATIATNNAKAATAAGNAQATQANIAQSQRMGMIGAAQASSGVDVSSGSPLGVRVSQSEGDALDTMTIRNNAARVAYGYQSQSTGFSAQSGLDTATGANAAAAGGIGAMTSILGGASSLGKQFSDFSKVGAFGSNAPNVTGGAGP